MANDENLKPGAAAGGSLRPPWGPGESGNPRGSSRKARQTADFKRLLRELDEAGEGVRAISRMWLREILAGNYAFFREYLDRVEGKLGPAQGEAEGGPASITVNVSGHDRSDPERPDAPAGPLPGGPQGPAP